DRLHQQRVIDLLRADVFQRLRRRMDDVVAPHDEFVFGGNPELKILPVTDHVKGAVANDGHQANHAQHGGFTYQNVAPNFPVVGDLAFFYAAHGGINVHGCGQRLNLAGLGVDVVDKLLFGRSLELRGAEVTRNFVGAKQATG